MYFFLTSTVHSYNSLIYKETKKYLGTTNAQIFKNYINMEWTSRSQEKPLLGALLVFNWLFWTYLSCISRMRIHTKLHFQLNIQ